MMLEYRMRITVLEFRNAQQRAQEEAQTAEKLLATEDNREQ